mgnify:CR=1 FL=1|jgi:hypothetical protein
MNFSERLLKYGEYLSDITNDTNTRIRIIEYSGCLFRHEMKNGEVIEVKQLDK